MLVALMVVSVSCADPVESDLDPGQGQGAESATVAAMPAATPTTSPSSDPPGLVVGEAHVVDSVSSLDGRSSGATTVVASDASTVEELLQHGLHIAGASPAHLAIRGTAAASSVRCAWRGIARTSQQRENAIRFWLQILPVDPIPTVAVVEALFAVVLDTLDPDFRETAKANFLAIARGGESMDYRFLTCFADYAVTHFLLGSGTTPTTVTVAYDRVDEAASYDLYVREHAAGTYGSDPLQTRGAYEAGLQAQVTAAEQALSAEIGGREAVVFLAPMGAHNAIGFEAWQAVAQWAVTTDDQGVVQAVRDDTPAGDPEHTQTLANLTTRITTAATTDTHATTRVTTVGGLQGYYRTTLKAYDDITPGDGETTTFTPAQPPPAPTCTNSTVIPNPGDHRELVKDCETLRAVGHTLRGTTALNWSTGTALSGWPGVATGGTPTRVTGLSLAGQSLSGTIPAELGRLFALTTLDLSNNRLTGAIPAELGWLDQLTELRLAGNALTGCLPLALQRVATNDLGSLSLPVCGPPPPSALSAGPPGETSVPLSWAAVPGVSKYRVEYRASGTTAWTVAADTLTGTTHPVAGLTCGTTYEFRVSAFGDGTTHGAAWGAPSAVRTVTTAACTRCEPLVVVSPTLTLGATVGARSAVTASWAYGAACAGLAVTRHSLHVTTIYADGTRASTAWQAEGGSPRTWVVDRRRGGTGAPLTRLTWTALDLAYGPDGAQSATVTFVEPPSLVFTPAAPASLAAGTATATSVPLTWAAVPNAATYRVEYRVSGAEPWTTADDTLTGTTHTVEGLTCGTAYEFRVSAYGDGTTLAEAWGAASTAVTATTGACPLLPAPAAPTTLAAGTVTATSVPLTWAAVPNAATYRVESRASGTETWILADDTLTTTTHTVDDLTCATAYEFRVSAYGDGTTLAAAWGEPSAPVTATTGACPPPREVTVAFGQAAYTVREGASVEVRVVLSAALPDPLSLALAAGGTAGTADYSGVPASVTVAAGATATSFQVTAVADAEDDGGERLTLSLGERPPGIGEGEPATATVTIQEAPAAKPPVFGAASYAFRVAENAAVTTVVGTVAATAATTVTYAITAGNDAGAFQIDGSSGALSVAGALDYETTAAYNLTVTASAGDAAATVAVAITVTNVADTAPPVPAGLAAGTVTATSVPLTWAAVTGAATYRVESRASGTETWTTDSDTLTATAHTVDGLTCNTAYDFRVSAYGDGTTYTAAWGAASTAVTATTAACPLPAPAAPASLAAGTATATSVPLSWDAVANAATYRVESRASGTETWTTDSDTLTATAHTVEGLTCGTAYEFRVSAYGDGTTLAAAWGAASTAVTATTAACPLPAPAAPASLAAGTVTATSVPLTWDAVAGAATYRVESRASGAETWTMADATLTATAYTVASLTCNTTYDFRVSAYGDGTALAAAWGAASTAVSATTSVCPPPVFGAASYAFSIAETAATGTAVGTVTATTTGAGPVAYTLTDGNSENKFAIGGATGQLTVAGALKAATTASYTLTVQARAGGASATTTVTVTVTTATPPAVTVTYAKRSYTTREGQRLAVTVSLSADPQRDVTIPLTVTPETADASDYTGVPASLTFGSGTISQSFQVAAVLDKVAEGPEYIQLGFGAFPAGVSAGAHTSILFLILNTPNP